MDSCVPFVLLILSDIVAGFYVAFLTYKPCGLAYPNSMPPEIHVVPHRPNRLVEAAKKYGIWTGLGGLAIGAALYLHHDHEEQDHPAPPPQPAEVITPTVPSSNEADAEQ
jgi:hypothetical protein